MSDLDSVNTCMDEGKAFIKRNPGLNEAQKAWGGLAWGFLRAIAECPNCPGVFRVALDPDWEQLACHNCGGVWVYDPQPKEPKATTKKRGKKNG